MTGPGRTIDLRGEPDVDLSEVVAHLRGGGVVAYPTETVYGLGGGLGPEAVAAVRRVKGRGDDKPLIALVESEDAVSGLAWTPEARELAAIFWPGAVTLVLGDPDRVFPDGVRDERTGSVAVRVSPHPLVTKLLHAFGAPITSTSLNAPETAAAASGPEAVSVLSSLDADDVWLLNAGTLSPSGPSTVVDCTTTATVLREGIVPIERLRCAIPDIRSS
jgi:L-threonylcarbamoyladenylate synthase